MVNAAFFHGAETVRSDIGVVPIRNDNLATIGLIGTAPMFLVDPENRSINEPIEVINRTQLAAFFGPDVEGFTIARYADAIFDQLDSQGGCKLQIINVLDEDSPVISTPVVGEARVFDNTTIIVGGRVDSLVVTKTGSGGGTAVEGTDYTFDPVDSRIEIITGSALLSPNDSVTLDYNSITGGNITTVTAEQNTFSSTDTISLQPGLKTLTLTGGGGTPVYVEDTDYTVDLNTGIVTRLTTGTIPFEGTVEATYDYVDPLTVNDTQIIGGTDVNGVRTGLDAYKDGFNLYGYTIKILISPGFSYSNALTAAFETTAEDLDCMAVVDAPPGTTYLEAINGRGPSGNINFNYANERLILQVPQFKTTRVITGQLENEFKSARYAGLWCNSILTRGFWFSPSNINYKGVQGLESKFEYIPNRADTEANTLNERGISTTINFFGRGFREFGNRSSVFPSDTGPRNFISIKFSEIAITEAIRAIALDRYVDRPINDDLINAILDSVNAYFRTLINVGGCIEGSRCYYDVTDNDPITVLGQGQIIFTIDYLPPPPAERITFKSVLNLALLNNLNTGRQFLGV